ncbi:NAD(P)/FAD-dependent oxidoreductase [Clostridium ihumii]|uniref:NAD(P)/FAD-dependent oxidoreductase n=1 Tax=Clostridium ihumii TaxID=1470356 RepID=UPI003D32B635
MYDVIIIGAGVIGSSIAREVSKYNLNTLVLEKGEDVSVEVSKANSGIVHAGFHFDDTNLKGKLSLRGKTLIKDLSKKLDFPFKENGSLVLAFNNDDLLVLAKFKENADKRGIDTKLLTKEEILNMEPNINANVIAALYCKSSAIVNPYEMTIALAENACENGVNFKFNSKVINIEKHNDIFNVFTETDKFESKIIINAAGIYGDTINNILSENKLHSIGVKGEYCLFDKVAGGIINSTLYPIPTKESKGVLVTPTTDGNLLVGPNAESTDGLSNTYISSSTLSNILNTGKNYVNNLQTNRVITTFAGVRPKLQEHTDFIIEECSDVRNFINVLGIDSPGLTAAPAIGEYVSTIIQSLIFTTKKENFKDIRKGILKFSSLSLSEKNKLIKSNPLYGKIICQCEMITEGEVVDAINRPLGATTLDAVKRRTRATMGGCQGTGCMLPVLNILSRELNKDITSINKNNTNSFIVTK